MLTHLAGTGGGFERRIYQQEWLAAFGPGGSWVRYADRPTRRTVAHLLACATPQDFPAVSGADDDELPALECIPAIVGCHRGTRDELMRSVQAAVAVTHDNQLALDEVLAATPLPQALALAAARDAMVGTTANSRDSGIPLGWLSQLRDLAGVVRDIETLLSR